MISQTAEYALRAVVSLAEADGPRTTREIAEQTRVPNGYLSKVLQALTQAGLVRGRRGLGGGFLLLKPADEMTVYEVLQAVDPIQRIHKCPLGTPSHKECLCPLHQYLDDAMATIEASFQTTTISDLRRSDPHHHPLCGGEKEPSEARPDCRRPDRNADDQS